MKAQSFLAIFCLTLGATLSGCSVVEGIFKAGMGVGIFIVLIVIIIIAVIVMKANKK